MLKNDSGYTQETMLHCNDVFSDNNCDHYYHSYFSTFTREFKIEINEQCIHDLKPSVLGHELKMTCIVLHIINSISFNNTA